MNRSLNLGVLALIFVLLKLASVLIVSNLAGRPSFPGPLQPSAEIVTYFQAHSHPVMLCAFLQFGSAIAFGIFTAAVVARLRTLGAWAAGIEIAFFGGLAVAIDSAASGFVLWSLTQVDISQSTALAQSLYFVQFAFGGPGFAVPMGLFIAAASIAAAFAKFLPPWVVAFGFVLAFIGELTWFYLIAPGALTLALIPLTRFPAFLWLILAGFMLPNERTDRDPASSMTSDTAG